MIRKSPWIPTVFMVSLSSNHFIFQEYCTEILFLLSQEPDIFKQADDIWTREKKDPPSCCDETDSSSEDNCSQRAPSYHDERMFYEECYSGDCYSEGCDSDDRDSEDHYSEDCCYVSDQSFDTSSCNVSRFCTTFVQVSETDFLSTIPKIYFKKQRPIKKQRRR